ncbi:MerR family transcriptional regulator [Phenylobacterium terrae]|uniref:MerR family transcriptional regulator n=1 Tax=Phenylobacterium terrae TaxID=2665495 RepID=A0ABW4N340_9CAUL
MTASAPYLSPAEAARRLGVSAKALRLYEARGLVTPVRTGAGWRAYGPGEMARAAEVAALRALGFSLAQVGRVLDGDAQGLEPALAAHQARLEAELGQMAGLVDRVRGLRAALAQGASPSAKDLARLAGPAAEPVVAFDLPWPWGGERFELRALRALTWIVGPLGSGKTRLALRLAETLPNAAFVDLDRLADGAAAAKAQVAADPALAARVAASQAWLVEDGATPSDALTALLAALEADGPAALVVDIPEQGLDEATQLALAAHLRRRGPGARPLFVLTRSCAMLDLAAVGPEEAILLCPANHSPPTVVAPFPGAPGYEAVATCLATPEARARTEGMIAVRPAAA